jgi:hypothetical protein
MLVSLILGFVGVGGFVGPQGQLDMIAECLNLPKGTYQIGTPSGDGLLIKGADDNGFSMLEKEPGAAVGIIFAAFAIAGLWLFLLRTYTRAMVWGTLIMSLAMIAVGAGYALALGLNDIAYVFLGVLLLEIIYLAVIHKSINTCADLLSLACQALMHYPSILLSHALLGLVVLVSTLVTFVFMVMTQFNIEKYEGLLCLEPKFAGYIGTFQMINWLALGWWVAVIGTVRLFVSAFVAGQWYFHAEGDRVSNPSFVALGLAFTKSLGSLAVAGIVAAFVNWAKNKVRKMKRTCNPIQCLIAYLLGCLLKLIEFLNSFAVVMVGE